MLCIMYVSSLLVMQALFYLAQVPSNRLLMKSEMGLLISVRRIINRYIHPLHYTTCVCSYIHIILIGAGIFTLAKYTSVHTYIHVWSYVMSLCHAMIQLCSIFN